MINFKTNKIVLALLLVLASIGMNGTWAMKRSVNSDVDLPGAIDRPFCEKVYNLMMTGNKGAIGLKKDGVQVAYIVFNFDRKDLFQVRGTSIVFDEVEGVNSIDTVVGYFTTHEKQIERLRLQPPPPPQPEPVPAPTTYLDQKSQAAKKSWFAGERIKNLYIQEDVIKSEYLNRYECLTAAARLAAIELSQYCKGKDGNSTKALLSGILADIFRMSNDLYAWNNQHFNNTVRDFGSSSWLDTSTLLFVVADALNIAAKTSNLFGGQKTSKKKIDLAEAKKDVKVSKVLKLAKKFNTIAPHFEGVAAVARSLTKLASSDKAKIAQCCTLFISLTRIVQYLVETADSKFEILQATPYLMLAATLLALLSDWNGKCGLFKPGKRTQNTSPVLGDPQPKAEEFVTTDGNLVVDGGRTGGSSGVIDEPSSLPL